MKGKTTWHPFDLQRERLTCDLVLVRGHRRALAVVLAVAVLSSVLAWLTAFSERTRADTAESILNVHAITITARNGPFGADSACWTTATYSACMKVEP